MKRLLPVLVALFFAVNCMAQPRVGSDAPDIKLVNMDGRVVTLSSLKGKVVVLDFWASWCAPCRRTISALKTIYGKYKDKGMEVYAISVDTDKNEWLKAIKEDGTTWVHVSDADYAVARSWKVELIPNTYLLDKTGKIVSVNANRVALEQQIAGLLN